MKEGNKKLFLLFGFLFLSSLIVIFKKAAWSYDTVFAHPMLTEKAVSLFNNQNTADKLSAEQAGWVIQGARDEDAAPRWMNHFYNPTNGLGLAVFTPANIWANSSLAQSSYLMGDQSWQTSISAYANGDKKRAFVALGHVLHLLEDMAVPAHTRIDAHPEGDFYENWVKNSSGQKISISKPISFNNLNEYFISLAGYSNKHFFSKDTVNEKLVSSLKIKKVSLDNKIINCYISYDSEQKEFCLLSGDINFVNQEKKLYYLTNINHSDYYSLLAPKVISYGAGVIDLFFKQAKAEENKKLSILDKLKQTIIKTTGKLISDFTGLFGKYQAAIVDYSQNLAGVNSNDNAPANNQPQNQGQVLSAQETADESDDARENTNPPNPLYQGGGNSGQNTTPLISPLSGGSGNTNSPNVPLPEGRTQPLSSGGNNPIFVAGDSLAPETAIESAPGKIINLKSTAFIFNSNEANSTFECKLDNGGWSVCGSPHALNNLTDGSHTFKVRALDSSNNIDQTPAEYSWTVDTIAPLVTITGSPDINSTSTSASFSFESDETGVTFICDLDLNGREDCTSPKNYENLTQGAHNFKVEAEDKAGNVSSTTAEFNWTISLTESPITIVSGPPNVSSSTAANFQFASEQNYAGYQCSLDGEPWQSCSASTTAADLIEGRHSLEVRGLDAAGNTGSSTSKLWLVDLTAPTSMVASLNATYTATGFTINWSGGDVDASGATSTASGIDVYDVQYKISAGDWQDWVSATTSTSTVFNIAVANGQMVYFRSRARDLAGNQEDWPASDNGDANITIMAAAEHLLISEARTGGSSANDFIELYNPTDSEISLSGYSIQYRGGGAINFEKKNFLADTAVKAKSYFLIAASEYDSSVSADFNVGFDLTASGGTIFLVSTTTKLSDETATNTAVVDRLAYGSGDYLFPEGAAYAAAPDSGQSLERKTLPSSTVDSMSSGTDKLAGNGYDSDNNSADFILRNSPEPQNSLSLAEPRDITPDSIPPVSAVAALDATYEATGFTVSWSGEDFDDAGATTTASGIVSFDLQYKIDAGAWQDWISATTSTSTVFSLAAANGQTIYFRSRARDLSGNLENWPMGDNGDTSTVIDNSPAVVYDVVRDDAPESGMAIFARDYMITDFRPVASSISGVSIKTTNMSAANDFNITLCKGAVNVENSINKIDCGFDDTKIVQKTCSTVPEINAWQDCSFDNSFYITPTEDYYVIVSDNTWLGSTWSDSYYGRVLSCGFNGAGADHYCFHTGINGFLTLRTYYDRTIPY